LETPLHHYVHNGKEKHVCMAWVDGSWDQDKATGAIGGMLLTPHKGGHSFSSHIPAGLCAELRQLAKKQRNTQSELLAILVLLLTLPEELRGTHLILFEDNFAALSNVLAGAAGDTDSVALVSAIWLVTAALRLTLWIEYVPSESNPGDSFSRPGETKKQNEAAEYTKAFGLTAARPRIPASVFVSPVQWAQAMREAQRPTGSDRVAQARVAAQLGTGAVDDSTIRTLLRRVHFAAQSGEVSLGWVELRRKGIIGAATGCHGDLTRVLCAAFKQRFPEARCTSIVLSENRVPAWPTGATARPAVAWATDAGIEWCGPWPSGRDVDAPRAGTALAFYSIDIAGIAANRTAAGLMRYGFPL
jgi:hypothetical protein